MSDRRAVVTALRGAIESDLSDDIRDALEEAADALLETASFTARPLGEILLRAVPLLPDDLLVADGMLDRRSAIRYDTRQGLTLHELAYVSHPDLHADFSLDPQTIQVVVNETNKALLALYLFGSALRVSIAELLQLRNLSGLVGEVVVSELERQMNAHIFRNPHQDGYPDLLPLTPDMRAYKTNVERRGMMSSKESWTDPGFGGIEVKSTAGNTPPASQHPKPGLGEERSLLIKNFDWKAHHRETVRLLAIIWDFVDGIPTISAIFFRNDLREEDWGRTVTPRRGGGRTTSVSVMKRSGVKKLSHGWLVRSKDSHIEEGLRRGKVFI